MMRVRFSTNYDSDDPEMLAREDNAFRLMFFVHLMFTESVVAIKRDNTHSRMRVEIL